MASLSVSELLHCNYDVIKNELIRIESSIATSSDSESSAITIKIQEISRRALGVIQDESVKNACSPILIKHLTKPIELLEVEFKKALEAVRANTESKVFENLLSQIRQIQKIIKSFTGAWAAVQAFEKVKPILQQGNMRSINVPASSGSISTTPVVPTSIRREFPSVCSSRDHLSMASSSCTRAVSSSLSAVRSVSNVLRLPIDTFHRPFYDFIQSANRLGKDEAVESLQSGTPLFINLCVDILPTIEKLKKCKDLPSNILSYVDQFHAIISSFIEKASLEATDLDNCFLTLWELFDNSITPYRI